MDKTINNEQNVCRQKSMRLLEGKRDQGLKKVINDCTHGLKSHKTMTELILNLLAGNNDCYLWITMVPTAL